MIRRSYIVYTVLFCLLARQVWAGEKKLHIQMGKGDLATSLQIFNLYDEQPEELQTILKAAHAFLIKDKERTLAEFMRQPGTLSLYQQAGLTHSGGPMLGCLSETGASVWVRTLEPASVVVRANGQTFGPVKSTAESDLTAIVRVEGLKPDAETAYSVLIDGKPIRTSGKMVIRTVTETPAVTRIAFGSCWHRWGLGHPMMDRVRQRKPRAMLMIGDIAVQDRMGHLGAIRLDVMQRDLLPRWAMFCSEIPVYTGWDDHDYADNDISGIMKNFTSNDRENVRYLWTQSWVNPQYGFDSEGKGIFLKTRIGPADVIMTDNRSFRTHHDKSNTFLGNEQMDWLKQQLLACRAPFIIVSCGTMWSDYVSGGKDSWGKYDPDGREEIFRFIEKHKIGGVLLISGDRHGTRGFTIPRENGFAFYEFGAASYGGRSGPPAKSDQWTRQLYGMTGEYAFSEFEFDTTQEDPEVTLRVTHASGNEIYSKTLKRSQLMPF